jgi:ABC-2 type transport system ATP-binding protein
MALVCNAFDYPRRCLNVVRLGKTKLPNVTVENLSKYFGDLRALENVSLSLGGGEGLAVVGANGAGKSTLLNCIAGIAKQDIGSIVFSPDTNIGYLAHKSFLYDAMTVEANLHFWGRLAGTKDYKARAAALIEQAGLAKRAGDKVRTLSAGMQKRTALCRAIMNQPDILLLDEPYSALDESGTAFLKQVVSNIKGAGGIVIIATHYIEQALAACTHVVLLERGRMKIFEKTQSIDVKALRQRLAREGAMV